MILKLFGLAVIITAAIAAYARLAPYDAQRWHVAPQLNDIGDKAGMNSFHAVREVTTAPEQILKAFELVILRDKGTLRVSGMPNDGLVTYQSRTKIMGYPDYTTVGILQTADGRSLVSIFGRSRIGKSDLGVNAARINRWIRAMGPMLVTPDAE